MQTFFQKVLDYIALLCYINATSQQDFECADRPYFFALSTLLFACIALRGVRGRLFIEI